MNCPIHIYWQLLIECPFVEGSLASVSKLTAFGVSSVYTVCVFGKHTMQTQTLKARPVIMSCPSPDIYIFHTSRQQCLNHFLARPSN